MNTRIWMAALALLATSATALAQGAPAALTDADKEAFLREARIVSTKRVGIGVTESVRATLSDGTLTHDAHIQIVDSYKPEFRTADRVERSFRDSWRYNIAAYRLDRMLDLRLVPVTIERPWRGRGAAFTWWVDDVMMDERKRVADRIRPPDHGCFDQHAQMLRMFDQLIENTDRNLGNTLYSRSWRIWAIDHTRAFRRSPRPADVDALRTIDPEVLERLAALDAKALKRTIGKYVDGPGIRHLLSRRDALLEHYGSLPAASRAPRPDPAAGCGTQRANAAAPAR